MMMGLGIGIWIKDCRTKRRFRWNRKKPDGDKKIGSGHAISS